MIYNLLLQYRGGYIEKASTLIGPKKPIMKEHCPQFEGLDPTILRTCRPICEETLDILYTNRFEFCDPGEIERFGYCGLGEYPYSMAGWDIERYGRLWLVIYVRLVLDPISPPEDPDTDVDRESLWSVWSEFLHPRNCLVLCSAFQAWVRWIWTFSIGS